MRAGFRRPLALSASLIGAIFVVLYAVSSWTLLNTTDTGTYVRTTDLVIDQPQVQEEIATTIVDSVVGDAQLPDDIVTLLNNGARLIVASDGFHEFWKVANRAMHAIVREQLLGNAPVDPTGARIDITAEVNLVLENLRQIDPRLPTLLPNNAPETSVQIVDQETLTDIRDAISGLERLKTFSAISAFALFAISTLILGLRRRSLVLASAMLWVSALAIYAVSITVPMIAERFVDEEFRATTHVVATHMASTLTTSSWQIVFFGLVGFVIAFFPRKNTSEVPVR